MARNLTAVERRSFGEQALDMSALGFSNVTIAERLGINRKTVPGLLKEAAEEATPEQSIEVARAKAHYRRIIRTCWSKLQDEKLNVNSHNLPALISAAGNAQARLDKLNGIEAPQKLEITNKLNLIELARATEGVPPEDRIRLVG